MSEEIKVDIKENELLKIDAILLQILLKDHSSGNNIIWATDDYESRGVGYGKDDQILPDLITGKNGNLIKPRTKKTKQEQLARIRGKAEVFTPSWICNKQNNLVDNAWFEQENVFNTEIEKTWESSTSPIPFPTKDGKTWQDYVTGNRLEITCGEAPYLVSRYDAVTGITIPIKNRIGLLDRKLRVVSENVNDEQEWYHWATEAVKSIYGFDWQGDNVLLARENVLFTFCDYYEDKFGIQPSHSYMRKIAEIVSWNVWQMDGLKFVIPGSCKSVKPDQLSLFDDEVPECPCPGCAKNDYYSHTGIYCKIKDWKENKTIKFVSVLKKDKGR